MTPRVVFDCMVFLQGAGRPASPAGSCFRLVDEERATLYISAAILAEVRDVLTRPKTLRRFPLLSTEWVDAFLANVASKALVIADVPRAFTLDRDPKDEPYVNLALAVGALYLVSRDNDLLDLMLDEGFRQRFPNLTILTPESFLQAITRDEQDKSAAESQPALGERAEATQEPGLDRGEAATERKDGS